MNGFSKLVRLAAIGVFCAALGACGSSSSSPVAPSAKAPVTAAPAAPAASASGASIDGTVVGLTGAQRYGLRAQSTGPTISVMGTGVSSPIDASGHFSLQGVPSGNVTLQVTGASVMATLQITGVTDHEQIHVTIQVNGSTATEDDSDSETPDNHSEIEGRITAINGNTLTVAGIMVTVPTGTPIQHGGTSLKFSDLQLGERVHIKATKSGSTVTATSIEAQTANPGNPGPPPGDDQGDKNETDVSGTISSLGGSCPTLTFKLGTTTVTTNAQTEFEDSGCSKLANGQSVEVQGTTQTSGSVLASKVEVKGKN